MLQKSVKQFIRDNNLTEDELDYMWEYCASFPELGGKLIKRLSDSGVTWRTLNTSALSSLIPLYEQIFEKVIKKCTNGECIEKGDD